MSLTAPSVSTHPRLRHHDLVVIGTGSGNFVDHRFDDLDIGLVESGVFGGTCLNVGCIPTKMYVYSADVADAVRGASRYGVDATVDVIQWADIRDRVFGRIDPIAAGGREYRVDRCPNITVYEGHARFSGYKELTVEHSILPQVDTFTADRVVIATGSRPVVPQTILDAGVPFHTSDTIMRVRAVPDKLVILGSGYIAAEFAHVFSALGAQVSVIGRSAQMLRSQDETVSQRFTALASDRWDLRMGHQVTHVTGDDSHVEVQLGDGSTVSGDVLLVAVGRTPNTDLLDLPKTGVTTHPDGRIIVDSQQRTTVDGIYALGDASSPYQLKHVANRESRVVAHNLVHPDAQLSTDYTAVPSAVFSHPQIAAVGRTEAQCRDAGLDYTSYIQAYGDVAYGWAMEDTSGFCKLIADTGSGKLLGAHIMGPQASSIIQPLIQAMSFGLGAREMATGQYWIHPGLPEVVENALLGLDL